MAAPGPRRSVVETQHMRCGDHCSAIPAAQVGARVRVRGYVHFAKQLRQLSRHHLRNRRQPPRQFSSAQPPVSLQHTNVGGLRDATLRHKSQRQRSPPRGASRHNSDATLRHNSQPPAILAEIAAFRRNSQRQRSRGMSEGRMGPNFNLIHRVYSCSSFGVPTFGVFLDGVRYPIRRRSCRA